jgi:RNA polymerase primary sigma factor
MTETTKVCHSSTSELAVTPGRSDSSIPEALSSLDEFDPQLADAELAELALANLTTDELFDFSEGLSPNPALEAFSEPFSEPFSDVLSPSGPDSDRPAQAKKASTGYSRTVTDDAVGAFFKDMARYPLLKASEEVELAKQVKKLVEIEALRAQLTETAERPPTQLELAQALNLTERELACQVHQYRIAKRNMVRSNLRLVVSIAKRYLNRGVPFLDLIQEGALGLHRATEKFDPDKGYKFSTYAYWWIRQGITRTIANDARIIRLPIHVVEKLNKLKRLQREFKQEFNRNPTELELANALEISPEQLRNLQQVKRQSLSLNHRVGKGEDTELLDLLEDGSTRSPELMMSEGMMRQEIWQVLDNVLTRREKDVISLRYGLASSKPCTLEEVGGIFNLSRERVRQIQSKAMRKLRRPQVAEQLKGWLG